MLACRHDQLPLINVCTHMLWSVGCASDSSAGKEPKKVLPTPCTQAKTCIAAMEFTANAHARKRVLPWWKQPREG